MDEIQELLDRIRNAEQLGEMENDALAEAQAQLEEEIGRLGNEPTTRESIARVRELNDAIDTLGAEAAVRIQEEAEMVAEMEAELARAEARRAADEEAAAEGEGEPAAETEPEAPAEEPAEEPAEQPAEEPAPAQAVAASSRPARTRPRAVAPAAGRGAQAAHAQARQAAGNGRPAPELLAGPDLRSFSNNQRLAGWDEAALALGEMLDVTRRQECGQRRVVTLDWREQFAPTRSLVAATTGEEQLDIVRSIVAPDGHFPLWEDRRNFALSAAGGLCAPAEVRYDVADLATDERPLRDGLPAIRADRGALTHMPPPVPSQVVVDTTSGAITGVTVSEDSSGKNKTVQEFTCPTSITDQVSALAERLRFGNTADRYWPENMRAVMNVTRAVHSRQAERRLFEKIQDGSVILNSNSTLSPLGAFPQFIAIARLVCRRYRYQFRLPENTTMRVILPTWFIDVLADDLLGQAPGDDILTRRLNVQSIMEDQLADFACRPIYQRDDARTNDSNGASGPAFADITAAAGRNIAGGGGATLTDYPGRVPAVFFHEGAWLFLDGGQLDLGIYRDSTLNTTNKFETFYEIWETASMVGYASWNVTLELCATGTRSALATVDCMAIGS